MSTRAQLNYASFSLMGNAYLVRVAVAKFYKHKNFKGISYFFTNKLKIELLWIIPGALMSSTEF